MPTPRPRVFRVKEGLWVVQWTGVAPGTMHKSWAKAFGAALYLFKYRRRIEMANV